MELFQKLDSERTFNIIDSIVAEELVRNAEVNGAVVETRLRMYNEVNTEDTFLSEEELNDPGYIPGNYTQMSEAGYAGLGPPL